MPNRSFGNDNRYGFNGKERDKDIASDNYDFGARIYDARIARWLKRDPVIHEYESPYMAFANNPIWILDSDGEDTIKISRETDMITYRSGNKKGYRTLDYFSTTVIEAPGDDVIMYKHTTEMCADGYTPWIMRQGITYTVSQGGKSITSSRKKKPFLEEINTGPGSRNVATDLYDLLMTYTPPSLRMYLAVKNPDLLPILAAAKKIQQVGSQVDALLSAAVAATTLYYSRLLFTSRVNSSAFESYASMSNKQVRNWYNQQLNLLNTNIDATEVNATRMVALRNQIKLEARMMMKNRADAALLDQTDPIRNFDYYKNKYMQKGYSGEALWRKIIEGSKKANVEVNKKFGIK